MERITGIIGDLQGAARTKMVGEGDGSEGVVEELYKLMNDK